MKKIYFVINSALRGGAAKMMNYVADVCADNYEVKVISIFDHESDETPNNRIEYKCLGLTTNDRVWRIKAILGIRGIVSKEQPTVVCAFISDVAFMSRIATLHNKCIFCSAERGDPYSLNKIWRILISWTYKSSDYCFFQLENAATFFGRKVVRKSYIIPNPLSEKNYPAPFNGKRKKTVVSVGRFEYQKGYDMLINAFVKVHEQHPDYQLILYGNGSLEEELKQQVEVIGLRDVIFFPGYSEHPMNDIKEQGIFVLSSRFEGIPNVLIEAMAVGIPTISFDCTPGGPAYLTDNGRRGGLVEANNVEALSDSIIELIEDEDKRSIYSSSGLEILNELTPQRINKLWLDAFSEIIKNEQ